MSESDKLQKDKTSQQDLIAARAQWVADQDPVQVVFKSKENKPV